jgi:HK97 family phage major capsid protein
MDPALIARLREERKTLVAQMRTVLHSCTTENRNFTPTENRRYKESEQRLDEIDERLTELDDEQQRRNESAAAFAELGAGRPVGGARVAGKFTYNRGNPEQSYFLDLVRAHRNSDNNATDRLHRHAEEMRSAAAHGDIEQRVNPNRTDGQGGYFVPPAWLVEEYVTYARPARVTADLCRKLPLPSGTDSINIPRVLTGTATGIQTADAVAVTSTDMTDDSISAPVRTIAGQQDVAMQLIDQSPLSYDQVIMADLTADYAQKLDLQVLYGSGASGQVKGLTIVSGFNSVTYTDASPTGPEMYVPMAQGLSNIATNIFMPGDCFVMHPRRWYWLASQTDTAGRPLVVPDANIAMNPIALQSGVQAQGAVGTALGLPVFLDPNLTTVGLGTAQTGGTQDHMLALRAAELLLWEGEVRTRVLTEVLSGTLQVRIQLYNYVAFTAERRPKAISLVSGTGMVAPAGF